MESQIGVTVVTKDRADDDVRRAGAEIRECGEGERRRRRHLRQQPHQQLVRRRADKDAAQSQTVHGNVEHPRLYASRRDKVFFAARFYSGATRGVERQTQLRHLPRLLRLQHAHGPFREEEGLRLRREDSELGDVAGRNGASYHERVLHLRLSQVSGEP